MTGLVVVFALLSAASAAVSTSVQHQAAEEAPLEVEGAWHLLGHLVRRPVWLVGQAFGVLALVMHALALSNGPLALVQPLVISGVVLAVPARAALSRRLPGRREVAAVTLAAVGLAVFLVASAPAEGTSTGLGPGPAVLVAGLLAVSFGAIAWSPKVRDRTRRAFLLGASAGVLFALVAVLLKATLGEFAQDGLLATLETWPPYALCVAGLGGITCNQFAYRAGRLSSSMPVLNVVDCLVALAFGYVVFGEAPRTTPLSLVLGAVALTGMLSGLWILARDAARELQASSAQEEERLRTG